MPLLCPTEFWGELVCGSVFVSFEYPADKGSQKLYKRLDVHNMNNSNSIFNNSFQNWWMLNKAIRCYIDKKWCSGIWVKNVTGAIVSTPQSLI